MKTISTIDNKQIKHFAKESKRWWDKNGPFKPLHKMNPARIDFITEQICNTYKRNPQSSRPLEGLNILDIGCGGGLVCEPLAKIGAKLTGIDADTQAIQTAKQHAKKSDIEITYLNNEPEKIKQKFDVVLALEILEHVSDASLLIEQCSKLLNPGGIVIFSTLNRTAKSFALGILAAEYIMQWISKGTHSWHKFIKPSELTRHARAHNLQPVEINGIVYNPLKDSFTLNKNKCEINYIMSFLGA